MDEATGLASVLPHWRQVSKLHEHPKKEKPNDAERMGMHVHQVTAKNITLLKLDSDALYFRRMGLPVAAGKLKPDPLLKKVAENIILPGDLFLLDRALGDRVTKDE
eukprot:GSA25T00019274001.1